MALTPNALRPHPLETQLPCPPPSTQRGYVVTGLSTTEPRPPEVTATVEHLCSQPSPFRAKLHAHSCAALTVLRTGPYSVHQCPGQLTIRSIPRRRPLSPPSRPSPNSPSPNHAAQQQPNSQHNCLYPPRRHCILPVSAPQSRHVRCLQIQCSRAIRAVDRVCSC